MKIVCKMTTVLACCQTRRGGGSRGRTVERRLCNTMSAMQEESIRVLCRLNRHESGQMS